MTKDEALRLALEFIPSISPAFICEASHHKKHEQHASNEPCPHVAKQKKVYEAIKAALEAKDEPVAEFKSPSQRWYDGDDHDPRSEALYKFIEDTDFKHCGDSFCFKSGGDGDNGETLMFILDCWFASTPPQRTWVGLTDEEIAEVEDEYIVDYRIPAGSAWNFAKDIEAKLKDKNT